MLPLVFSLLGFALIACGQGDHVVKTTSGPVRGFSARPNVDAWLGIPYAKPPVGDLRFAPPEPLEASNGSTTDCFESSPGCFQLTYFTAFADRSTGFSESEDMLTINIWSPSKASPTRPLPVMIFIYPGAFTSGANGMPQYSGLDLVAEQQEFLFVSTNYRVNVWGFPNSPALPTKNIGILDQRLAVEWIRDNIRGFGGDPKKMVLSGQSAGSISAFYWSFAFAEDPIVRGLMEFSGQPGTVATDDGTDWNELANATGCANSNAQTELACMRSLPPRTIKRAMSSTNVLQFTESGLTGGAPFVDNKTVFGTDAYPALGKAGKFAKLPLLVSNALNEADIILPWTPAGGVNQTLSAELTLALFQCPVSSTASIWIRHNVTTYRYLYEGVFESYQPYPWVRAYHGSDISLILASVEQFQYQDQSAAIINATKYIRNAVTSFVKDPENGLANFGWERYNPNATTLMRLFGNETSDVGVISPSQYDAPCQYL